MAICDGWPLTLYRCHRTSLFLTKRCFIVYVLSVSIMSDVPNWRMSEAARGVGK